MFEINFSTGHYNSAETREELVTWLNQNMALNSFGKNERWVRPSDFTGDESTENATIDEETGVSFRELDGDYDLPIIEYHFDAEYTYEIQDITVKYEKEQAIHAKINKGRMKTSVCNKALHYIIGNDLEDSDEAYGNIIDQLSKNRMGRSKTLIMHSDLIDATIKEDLLSFFPGA